MTASVVWRCIVAAVIALVLAIGVRAFFGGDTGDGFVQVDSDDAALDPQDAIQRAPREAIAVRGYVYDDGSFIQLCDGLTDGDPPTCRGPSLLLRNLDLARLDLTGRDVDGVRVLYAAEPVVLGGTVVGTQLTVLEVLSG